MQSYIHFSTVIFLTKMDEEGFDSYKVLHTTYISLIFKTSFAVLAEEYLTRR